MEGEIGTFCPLCGAREYRVEFAEWRNGMIVMIPFIHCRGVQCKNGPNGGIYSRRQILHPR